MKKTKVCLFVCIKVKGQKNTNFFTVVEVAEGFTEGNRGRGIQWDHRLD